MISIVPLTGDDLAEHLGKVSGPSREASCEEQAQPLSVNVIYTGAKTTTAALRAVESLACDLGATVHIRAMIVVPTQLAIEFAFSSVQFLTRLLNDLVEQVGSKRCEYFLHIYICRSRVETLLRVLWPSSLLVIAGRRRIWPTKESRLSKAAKSAGHSVVFVDSNAFSTELGR